MNFYIIDTCSWIALARYYSPFDSDRALYNLILTKIKSNEILLLSEVANQSRLVSKKIAANAFDFILEKDNIIKTEDLVADAKFQNIVINQLSHRSRMKTLTEFETEAVYSNFYRDADCKIILKALSLKGDLFNNVTIITEETNNENDSKYIKKIPSICEYLKIDCISVTEFLESKSKEIQFSIN